MVAMGFREGIKRSMFMASLATSFKTCYLPQGESASTLPNQECFGLQF